MRPSNSASKFIFFESAISNVALLSEDAIPIVVPDRWSSSILDPKGTVTALCVETY